MNHHATAARAPGLRAAVAAAARRRLLPLALLCTAALPPAASFAAWPTPDDHKTHVFAAANDKFTLDGQDFQVIAGEMHLARVPHQFWEDRIKKARAMGLNTVSVYIFWNQLEPAEGKFDFTGDNDVRTFVKLCQDNGMWVALRPGPYVCAETEFGGYPAWLLKHHDIQVRTDDPKFIEYSRQYIKALHEQVGDLLVTHGGPVLMTQIENELGRIDKFLDDNRKAFLDAGFDGQLFTCDHSGPVWNKLQGLPGILRATNGLPNEQKLDLAKKVDGHFPVYGSEVYTSWFSVWGGPVGGGKSRDKSVDKQLKDTQWLLDRKLSWCYYMYDGGTNFGFSNGANQWQPVQTTYDYGAPIDELGRVTPKYHALRDLFTKTFNLTLPPVPADPNVITLPTVTLAPQQPLLATLPSPRHVEDVVTMEDLDQSYGFVLYRKQFPSGVKGQLDLHKNPGYSIVLANNNVVGKAFAGYGPDSYKIALNQSGPCTLDVLAYNTGRNSVGINQKISHMGLNENPTLEGKPVTGWDVYSLPMDAPPQANKPSADTSGGAQPMIYTGTFNLAETGETYIDMRNWHFGVAYVNGHNLGRYWDVGADRCLYLPSAWQNKGKNEITILELLDAPKSPTVSGSTKLIEEPPVAFTPDGKNAMPNE